jgi:transposase
VIPPELEADIVRRHLVDRWPVGTIAFQLGVHHGVVRRVLRQHGQIPPSVRRPSKIDPFVPFIAETLKKHPRLPASRLFDMVCDRGYVGGPDHFRSVIAKLRPKPAAEAYMRLRTLPGEEAQVDWAHFGKVQVGSATRPLVAFLAVLSWSRRPFLRFGYDMRMGSFLEAHQRAFEFFGGVPRVLLYDNLKSAVVARVGDAIQFNPEIVAFARHYRYEPRPVGVRRGNEKGRVERTIQFVRSSFFPARSWSDLDDLNRQALTWCTGRASARRCPGDRKLTVGEAYDEEKPRLLPLPADRYPTEDVVPVRVGKTPYVRFDANDYSVPHEHVQRILTLRASPDRVRVFADAGLVAEHDRTFDRDRTVEDPAHIAVLEAAKANAREGRGTDRLLRVVPECRALLLAVAEAGGNLGGTTISLLRQLDTFGAEALAIAVREAVERDTPHLHAVRLLLDRNRAAAGRQPPVRVDLPEDLRRRDTPIRPHRLASYDEEAP